MKKRSIKILVADDHSLIIGSISSILLDIDNVYKVYKAKSKSELFSVLTKEFIDLIFLDINMNGINMLDHIEQIRDIHPKIIIIILTSYSSLSIVNEAIEKKVDAFLHKNTDKDEILFALNRVLNGEKYMSIEVKHSDRLKDGFQLAKKLTSQELKLIKLLAKGYTNSKISKILHISIYTVQTHRKNIHKKLGVKSVNELIAFAYENKLV